MEFWHIYMQRVANVPLYFTVAKRRNLERSNMLLESARLAVPGGELGAAVPIGAPLCNCCRAAGGLRLPSSRVPTHP